jgi:membrane protease YdiL (CAAX protease family)
MSMHQPATAPKQTPPATVTDNRYTNGRIALYIVLAFGLAWLLELGIPLTHTRLSDPQFIVFGDGAMLCPAIAAIVVLLASGRDLRDAGLWPRLGQSWRWYLAAFLIPLALVAVATALSVVLGQGILDGSLPGLKPLLHGKTLPAGLAPVVLAQTAVLGSLIGIPFGMGEELGWRGYLLPALLRRGLSPHKAIVVSGVIWGLWHAPLILMGYNYPHTPLLGVAMFCVFTVLLTYVLAWLRLGSGTTWTAALGHSAVDQSSAAANLLLVPGTFNSSIGTIVGPIGWVVAAMFVAWLLITGRVRRLRLPDAD